MKRGITVSHIVGTLLSALFGRGARLLFWYQLLPMPFMSTYQLYTIDPPAVLPWLAYRRQLSPGDPRMLCACACLANDDVGCACRCHDTEPVVDGDTAVKAFKTLSYAHRLFAGEQELEVIGAAGSVRGRKILLGHRVLCHFPGDLGSRCRGMDFPYGSRFPSACWETPERGRTMSARRFLSEVLDTRLMSILTRHAVLPTDPGYYEEMSSTNGCRVMSKGVAI